ncbi:MAG TPA: TIR domain-containing protein [Ktedonobacteraceae bacterium]
MQILNLLLSPIDRTHMKAIPRSYGGSLDVALPYEGLASRRTTILKALNLTSFDPQAFTGEGEQEWMVEVGLLDMERRAFHPNMRANIGKVLYQTLFPPDSNTKDLLHSMIFASKYESSREQILIQLEIEADVGRHSRLFDYPWELLHDERDFLAASGIAISRYIAYEDPPPNLLTVDRMNVLLVSSMAYDPVHHLNRLDEQERQAILDSLRWAEEKGRIDLHELTPATLGKLRQYVLTHTGEDTPYVIHFDGHGHFGRLCNNTVDDKECKTFHPGTIAKECQRCGAGLSEPEGYLLFEDNSGGPDYISAQEIGSMLGLANGSNKAGRGIALVVLSACKSSLALMEDSVFNGVAQNLIAHQIPAVVGMAFSVSVEGAKAFADVLYLALSQEKSLAQAMNWGRDAMGFKGNQWYRPSLYLRWRDNEGGQIFTIDAKRNQSSQDTDQISTNVSPESHDPFLTLASTVHKPAGSSDSKSWEATTLEKAFHYDAFISYSHMDSDWVNNVLLARLEQAGLRVCIDDRDFEIGVPSLDNMENAVDRSRKTLLILTPNWVTSEWTKFEYLMILAQDPTNLARRLLPLMVQHCTLPKHLNIFTYLDLTEPTKFDFQMQRLLSDFRSSALNEESSEPTLIQQLPQPTYISNFVVQAIECYRKIEANRSLVTEVSKLFLEKDIWPAQCRNANTSLQKVSNYTQLFSDLIDSATELTETDDKLRSSLIIPLNYSNDLLLELIALISAFSVICQPPSRESMIGQHEIQNKLKYFEESLDDVRTRMAPFDTSADSTAVAAARPETAPASSNKKTQPTKKPSEVGNDSGKLFEIMLNAYNLAETITLCGKLGIDDEGLRGNTKGEKILELIRYCVRHNRYLELINKVKEERPDLQDELDQIKLE